jgi:VanZ family protein
VTLEMPRHLIKGSDNFLQWPQRMTGLDATEQLEVVANVLLFLPLGLLLYRPAGPGGPWRRAAAVLVIGALTTLCFESIQFFVPGRTSSLVDALANTSGAALGVAVSVWCAQLRAKPPA